MKMQLKSLAEAAKVPCRCPYATRDLLWSCPGCLLRLTLFSSTAIQVQLSTAAKVRLRMPVGGASGGPLEVVLTQRELERLAAPLFRRARLPIDQACWQVLRRWLRDFMATLTP